MKKLFLVLSLVGIFSFGLFAEENEYPSPLPQEEVVKMVETFMDKGQYIRFTDKNNNITYINKTDLIQIKLQNILSANGMVDFVSINSYDLPLIVFFLKNDDKGNLIFYKK